MYRPTDEPHERLVIARIGDRHLPGVFTGEAGEYNEHFEIRFDDIFVDLYDTPKTARLHKEDLYKSNDENSERLLP